MSFGARAGRGTLLALGLAWAVSASAGEVRGTVGFSGPAPRPAPQRATKDMKVCGEEIPDESLLVSNGKLANVVVTIEGAAARAGARTIAVDQRGCRFVPRVQAVGVGSDLEIRNSDGILHNIHGWLGQATAFNLAMPTKDQTITRRLAKPGLLRLTCDVHSWMGGFILVSDAPAAVSDGSGRFAIADVPPGTYTARAWHERLGEKTARVTVPASGQATVDFKLGK